MKTLIDLMLLNQLNDRGGALREFSSKLAGKCCEKPVPLHCKLTSREKQIRTTAVNDKSTWDLTTRRCHELSQRLCHHLGVASIEQLTLLSISAWCHSTTLQLLSLCFAEKQSSVSFLPSPSGS